MRALLQNRSFRYLWLSQVALTIGDAMMQMGLIEYFRAHGFDKKAETAKLLFAATLAGLVLGPVVMAYLDKWQRRSVLVVSDVLRAVVVAAIAVWLWPALHSGGPERGLLFVYLIIFVIGAITTFYYPARSALMPHLVAGDQLVAANTLFSIGLAVANVGGRGVGGWVAERFGVEWAVLANSLAYVLSVIVLVSIRMDAHATTSGANAHVEGGWGELKLGVEYLRRHRVALPLVVLAGVLAFQLAILVVVFIGYSMDTLGLSTAGAGYLMIPGGVGAGLGILALGSGAKWTKADGLPAALFVGAGVMLTLLSVTREVFVAAAIFVGLGAAVAMTMVLVEARLQQHVEELRRGAVFAARGTWTSATMIVAFWLQFGTNLFRKMPAPMVLRGLGVMALVTAGLIFWTLRRHE